MPNSICPKLQNKRRGGAGCRGCRATKVDEIDFKKQAEQLGSEVGVAQEYNGGGLEGLLLGVGARAGTGVNAVRGCLLRRHEKQIKVNSPISFCGNKVQKIKAPASALQLNETEGNATN